MLAAERDRMEAGWLAEPPPTDEALDDGATTRDDRWRADARRGRTARSPALVAASSWAGYDRGAGLAPATARAVGA